jgi:uncharacterized membrane protein YphA (DoxX/SURF4 family)
MSINYLTAVLQIIVALGILNVWLLRSGRATSYRGGGAGSLREEFSNYGLSIRAMYVVGGLKIASAFGLLLGLFLPFLIKPSAAILIILMLGAIAMHLKIKDPLMRSLPAGCILLLSVLILIL